MRVDDATLCGGWKDLGNPLASIFTDALIIPAPFSPVRSAVCTAFSSCLPAFPKEGDDRMGTLSAPVAQLLERVATQSGRNPEVGFAVTGENPARSTIRESRGMEPCFVAPCREGVPNPDFLDTPQRPLDRATSQEAPNALAAPDGDNGRRLPGSFIKKPRNGALTAVRKSGQAPRFFRRERSSETSSSTSGLRRTAMEETASYLCDQCSERGTQSMVVQLHPRLPFFPIVRGAAAARPWTSTYSRFVGDATGQLSAGVWSGMPSHLFCL